MYAAELNVSSISIVYLVVPTLQEQDKKTASSEVALGDTTNKSAYFSIFWKKEEQAYNDV